MRHPLVGHLARALLIIATAVVAAAPATAQTAGHAHNDYAHRRALHDALSHGFVSVEADIHLRDGQLLVAHKAADLDPARTLESLYLAPLAARIARNGGSVHGDGRPFTLLIDVKTDAGPTYRSLHPLLTRYGRIMTVYDGDAMRPGPVVAIVSGNRASAEMARQEVRYAAYDGRLADLATTAPATLIPLISDRWTRHFTWRGNGAMPAGERARLDTIVAEAHAAGRRVRFSATPDAPGPRRDALWRVLVAAGVDLINTDDLAGLAAFLAAAGP